MSILPPPLRPWAPWLQGLVPEVAAGLSPMVQRLATLVGPMQGRPQPGGFEPDGVSGIGRRGSYERLLLSEWSLAEEVPEEFLRRAAVGEHLFLQLARVEPRVGRRCLVFLDAGPDQVGSPRLAHMALVVVLARRAEQAGAELQVVVLQEEPELERIRRHGGQEDLVSLLAARSPKDPDQDRLDTWLELLGGQGPNDELWLVGGARCQELVASGAQRLSVVEPLVEQAVLSLSLDRGGTERRELELPLPPAPHRTRLILAPFSELPLPARRPGASSRHHTWYVDHFPRGRVHFSHTGQRLLGLDATGNVVAWRVPDEPGETPRRPKVEHLWTGNTALCVGWLHQRPVVLRMKDDGELVVHNVKGSTWATVGQGGGEGPLFLPADEEPVLQPLTLVPMAGGVRMLFFIDHADAMWTYELGQEGGPHRVRPTHTILALTRRTDRLLHVTHKQGTVRAWLSGSLEGSEPLKSLVLEGCQEAAWVGPNEHGTPLFGLIMVCQAPGRWVDLPTPRPDGSRPRTRVVEVDPSWTVWGCTWTQARPFALPVSFDKARKATLLASPPDGSRLELVPEQGGAATVLPLSSPVRYAVSSPGQRRVAWVEDTGHVVVYDVSEGKELLRLEPPELTP